MYFGDNLYVLRNKIEANSVDLVYLDPPFNSKAAYNLLYETPQNLEETAQRAIFHDTWHWEDEAEDGYRHLIQRGGPLAAIMEGLVSSIGRKGTAAYFVAMAIRLVELRRILKPTGSIYLHCDPTASHYLKVILDAIFGHKGFCNEIIWQRTSSHNSAKRYGRIHDVILFYSVSSDFIWNKQYTKYSDAQLGRYKTNANGRLYKAENLTAERRNSKSGKFEWRGTKPGPSRGWAYEIDQLEKWWREGRILTRRDGTPRLDGLIVYRDEMRGQLLQDMWTDIPRVPNVSFERLGYPTQKPVDLLKRIITSSSNKGEVVLDPFCGCGTTSEAAQDLKRNWIGIDISYYAVRLIEKRIRLKFPGAPPVPIDGIPADLKSAEALADNDRYGFQQWVVGELGCQLWNDGKKGRDGGIDGEMRFYGGPNRFGRLLVQVKGGRKVGVEKVREFRTALKDAKGDMGIFFCRSEPTADMISVAHAEGRYRVGRTEYPRLQIFSLARWYAGQRPQMPVPMEFEVQGDLTTRAKRQKRPDPRQPEFLLLTKGKLEQAPKGHVYNPRFVPDDLIRNA